MIGRHPNIQKRWVHRARKGTVALGLCNGNRNSQRTGVESATGARAL